MRKRKTLGAKGTYIGRRFVERLKEGSMIDRKDGIRKSSRHVSAPNALAKFFAPVK